MAEAVAAATGAYREEEDVFGAFLADACTLSADARVTAKELYAAYEHWCQQNGERPVSARAVGIRLSERGLQRIKSGAVRLWSGVSLRDAPMRVAADEASQWATAKITSAAIQCGFDSSINAIGSDREELRI